MARLAFYQDDRQMHDNALIAERTNHVHVCIQSLMVKLVWLISRDATQNSKCVQFAV